MKSKKNLKKFEDNKVIVSRDENCPYRLEVLKFLKDNNLGYMSIIEVDTIDMLIDIVEGKEATTILPERTIRLNNKLEKFQNLHCNNVKVYVYKLKTNNMNFGINLYNYI